MHQRMGIMFHSGRYCYSIGWRRLAELLPRLTSDCGVRFPGMVRSFLCTPGRTVGKGVTRYSSCTLSLTTGQGRFTHIDSPSNSLVAAAYRVLFGQSKEWFELAGSSRQGFGLPSSKGRR
jgi:hypothetical protein